MSPDPIHTVNQTTFYPTGTEGKHVLPWSEVCLHMGVANQFMRFVVVGPEGDESVQLLNEDGSPFSFPILTGEAGLYRDNEGRLYTP